MPTVQPKGRKYYKMKHLLNVFQYSGSVFGDAVELADNRNFFSENCRERNNSLKITMFRLFYTVNCIKPKLGQQHLGFFLSSLSRWSVRSTETLLPRRPFQHSNPLVTYVSYSASRHCRQKSTRRDVPLCWRVTSWTFRDICLWRDWLCHRFSSRTSLLCESRSKSCDKAQDTTTASITTSGLFSSRHVSSHFVSFRARRQTWTIIISTPSSTHCLLLIYTVQCCW